MKRIDTTLRLSASDLANHLGCRHLTGLDRAAAEGRATPPRRDDPARALLEQRGFAHEAAYVDHLRAQGRTVTSLVVPKDDHVAGAPAAAFERTVAAMREGADVIVQPTLTSNRWLGRADVFLRVDRPSRLGSYSYEVVDTKLARETRAGTILQLCLYSEVVGSIQDLRPERMHVVAPGRGFAPETFRVQDYEAYYRLVKGRLETTIDAPLPAPGAPAPAATYPDPVPQCDICRWWPDCDRRRRADDHLCLVAGISKLQTREIQSWGVPTLDGLAEVPLPLERAPRRGSRLSYVRVREQARVQKAGRMQGGPVHELLPREPGRGLALLPAPSPGDLFFDVEGDPFVDDGGIEYLLGWAAADGGEYRGLWAFTRTEERTAFEAFVDAVLERWQRWPDLHIYHYTPYDPSALKRMMSRYATRETDIDRMLRGELFVDLHAVVRQSLRASVEKYSIKDLEPFFGFARNTPLPEASAARRAIERALELSAAECVTAQHRDTVESYNRDDCLSALRLRNWLEELRGQVIAAGEVIERPAPPAPEPEEESEVTKRDARFQALAARLTQDIPADPAARTPEQQATWMLAQVLQWHRREDKVKWWEFFRLSGLDEEQLLDEKDAIAGLEFVEDLGRLDKSIAHRYRFPRQGTSIRVGDEMHAPNEEKSKFGSVVAIDLVAGTVDIKKSKTLANVHPRSLFEHKQFRTASIADALFRMGEWVAEHGIDTPGPYRAGRDLLLQHRPRLAAGSPGLFVDGESTVDAARRLGAELTEGVLPIQGPPGTGKTYTGARMIVSLARAGRKVGVTAVSHKVIRNLLDEVARAAAKDGVTLGIVQKIGTEHDLGDARVRELEDKVADAALADPTVQVVGGTQWLWSAAAQHECVDVLFVDEAGQMSLANVLAASQGAKSLVLLGDPQQLEQPQQATHPEGSHVSALEHLLAGHATLPADRGLFLNETWRLHPGLCAFTSAVFYEARLESRAGLDRQIIAGPTRFAGAGLWCVAVEHEGNQSAAPEEVDAVVGLVAELTSPGVTWTGAEGAPAPITLNDILIVAPFNAQVADLQIRLPGARVGTVDRFQGQEAAVVIYSMTSSSPEDAPRGMEFLYSLTRLNVATSRARCATILVANPSLFEPDCRTPRQMQLANAFCRYLEMARPG